MLSWMTAYLGRVKNFPDIEHWLNGTTDEVVEIGSERHQQLEADFEMAKGLLP